ncbi:hypothetical protein [Hyphobacterium marinum]|uniref:Uncharacterized protein n=1 Tax=Hyphobacterium marinum TaxID=3116574 RepID=A0ABU7M0G2_9PROT|nr:hypothetical protein [Hyphobacterium sp. Y6023]MEE2567279.1 hypothetical protein [Hyphobacterium sp. Y6023]
MRHPDPFSGRRPEGGRASVADIPQVTVHETVHILQLQAQGGFENYRSVYNAGAGSSDGGLHALFSSYARPEIEAMADAYAHSLAAQ